MLMGYDKVIIFVSEKIRCMEQGFSADSPQARTPALSGARLSSVWIFQTSGYLVGESVLLSTQMGIFTERVCANLKGSCPGVSWRCRRESGNAQHEQRENVKRNLRESEEPVERRMRFLPI